MIIIKHITDWFCHFEELSDMSLVEKRHAEDPEHIKSTAIEAKVIFNNGDKAICRNRRVYLYPNCIFGYSPKRFYVQMLFDPFKQLHLPSVFIKLFFIKQSNVFSLGCKAISKICKSPLVFFRVVNNTSKRARIFLYRQLSCKPYRLVVENIVRSFKKVFTLNDFILKLTSLL